MRLENVFPLSTIKKFHAEIVFVAWLHDLSWEVKIAMFFCKKILLESSCSICYFIFLFFDSKYRLHLLLFSLVVMASPSCTCEPVGIQHLFEFLCVVSYSNDICTLQHGVLCFLLFLYSYFYSLFCIITRVCFLIPSAYSFRFGSRLWKVNVDQNWNLFYRYLFQRTPVIYNFISQDNVFLFAICFH